jgi:hypothetical protein
VAGWWCSGHTTGSGLAGTTPTPSYSPTLPLFLAGPTAHTPPSLCPHPPAPPQAATRTRTHGTRRRPGDCLFPFSIHTIFIPMPCHSCLSFLSLFLSFCLSLPISLTTTQTHYLRPFSLPLPSPVPSPDWLSFPSQPSGEEETLQMKLIAAPTPRFSSLLLFLSMSINS